jgi:hypothetical protein
MMRAEWHFTPTTIVSAMARCSNDWRSGRQRSAAGPLSGSRAGQVEVDSPCLTGVNVHVGQNLSLLRVGPLVGRSVTADALG